MSRSGYIDDIDDMWSHIRWRGAVSSAIRGKRGQAMLRELLAALDAMPEKELYARELEADGGYCTLGVLGKSRGIDMSKLDPEDYDRVALAFGLAPAMTREIVYENDECGYECWPNQESPKDRWRRMRAWVAKQLLPEPAAGDPC